MARGWQTQPKEVSHFSATPTHSTRPSRAAPSIAAMSRPPAVMAPSASPHQLAGTAASPTLRRWLLLGIGVLLALVYGQSAHFAFLEWDDPTYLLNNRAIAGGLSAQSLAWAWSSFHAANWHPLTWVSYLLDISLFGMNPAAMHVENALLHAVNSVLVYALFMRWQIRPLPSLLAAAVFALHPLHVESVVWIAERKDLLSTFFGLALLLVWDRHVKSGRTRDYLIALLLFALGLMAKPMLVSLPLLLLMLDAWPYARLRSGRQPWFRDRLWWRRCAEKIPFGVLALLCAWLTVLAQAGGMVLRTSDEAGLPYRLGNAIVSYAIYLAQTIAPPLTQSFIYLYPLPGWGWIGLALLGLGLFSWWAVRQGGPVLVGWLWFLVTLLPVIGLVQVGVQARADRYMYLPMIGLLLMLAATLSGSALLARLRARGWRLLWGAACALLLMQAGAAYRYAAHWRDSPALFSHALEVDAQNYVAHTMLAMFYEHTGQDRLCLQHAERVLQLAPRSAAAVNASLSASNAGFALGQREAARRYLEYAIGLAPRYPLAYYNLGTLELREGNLARAVEQFQRAIALYPRYGDAYNNLGVALLQSGRRAEAQSAFGAALRHDPGNRQARANLARSQGGMAW
jgi:protein O-mannosyl-transferase